MIDLWQEIYGTIRRNKLRTFLTGFAVAWGIFMLIVLLGAGNGLIHAFEQNTSQSALNSIRVFPGWTTKPYDGLQKGRYVQLDNRDVDDTGTLFTEHVLEAGATVSQGGLNISYGGEYVNLSLLGVYPNYREVEAVKTYTGRFINQTDLKERRKVIVLHRKSADVLFGKAHTDPLGKFVNVGGVAYQVVGTFTDQGNMEPSEAYVPFSTLQTIYNKGNKLKAANHRFDPEDDGAIWLWNRFTSYLQTQNAMAILRTAIWVIGIFTLLSGIVGVSNIMLITVRERTHEFGIRKALGAKPRNILWLIIVESVTITTVFGYVGLVAGIGATEWMNATFGSQTVDTGMFEAQMFTDPTVDLGIALQATLTLIIAGTLAGFFPARKATRIRPIEALRAD